MPHLIPEIARSLQMKGIEVLYTDTDQKINFEAFIKSRSDYYDIAFVSGPHNMHEVISYFKDMHCKQRLFMTLRLFSRYEM